MGNAAIRDALSTDLRAPPRSMSSRGKSNAWVTKYRSRSVPDHGYLSTRDTRLLPKSDIRPSLPHRPSTPMPIFRVNILISIGEKIDSTTPRAMEFGRRVSRKKLLESPRLSYSFLVYEFRLQLRVCCRWKKSDRPGNSTEFSVTDEDLVVHLR